MIIGVEMRAPEYFSPDHLIVLEEYTRSPCSLVMRPREAAILIELMPDLAKIIFTISGHAGIKDTCDIFISFGEEFPAVIVGRGGRRV